MQNQKLELTQEWDKTFPKSEKVNHSKVTFHNRYGVTLAADMYVPKDAKGKLPAVAVAGPFGAVKEQAAASPLASWISNRALYIFTGLRLASLA